MRPPLPRSALLRTARMAARLAGLLVAVSVVTAPPCPEAPAAQAHGCEQDETPHSGESTEGLERDFRHHRRIRPPAVALAFTGFFPRERPVRVRLVPVSSPEALGRWRAALVPRRTDPPEDAAARALA